MLSEELYYAESIEERYNQAMEYLDYMYHSYPTELIDIPVTPEQQVEMNSFSMYARGAGSRKHLRPGTPVGKMVV